MSTELLRGLAEEWAQLDVLRLQALQTTKDLSEQQDLRERQLVELLHDLGMESVRFDGIGTLYTTVEAYSRVTDKDRFFEWARTACPSLIHPEVGRAALKELVKDQLAGGHGEPPGVETYVTTKLRRRR